MAATSTQPFAREEGQVPSAYGAAESKLGRFRQAPVEEKSAFASTFTWVLIAAFLGLGTLNVICMKAVLAHVPHSGSLGAFEKPGFVTLQMFVGMGCGGALLNWHQGHSMRDAITSAALRQNWKVWVTTMLDLLSFLLDMVALVGLKPSVYMSLRGASAVWAFALRVSILKKWPTATEIYGMSMMLIAIALCTAGGCMTAPSLSHVEQSTSMSTSAFSVCLLLGSAFLKALQLTWEEAAMKSEDITPGALLIGQGVWGGIAMLAVLAVMHTLPGDDRGDVMENSLDTVQRLSEDPTLYMLACIALPLLMMGYNVLLKLVTKTVSGFCSIVMTFGIRPLMVWMLGLGLTYGLHLNRFGETWKSPCSFFTLVGMILWVVGAFVYHKPKPATKADRK
eukprot:gb/GFBE01035317.1/.p1 GENE.gb/GFBE01035317.1/~~gb/GFBE01035317.1/.p1  ORF type:complete len:394 (+),score=98.29 gb/GFBE01035317.1/:1-1182(+)